MIKKIIGVASLCVMVSSITLSANAFGQQNYDKNIVRAFNKVKLQKINVDMPLSTSLEDCLVTDELKKILRNDKGAVKALKNKPGVFLISKDAENQKIKNVYLVKNPEQFMFTLDKDLDKEVLLDRELIRDYINENITSYAIISEKIDRNSRSALRKTAAFSYNGLLYLMTVCPKFGLGYVVNPVFYKLRTNTAVDMDSRVTEEIENLAIGEKEFIDIEVIDLRL